MSRIEDPSRQEKSTGQSIREMGSQAKEAAQEQIGHLRETAGEYYQQGKEMAQEYYEQGREKAMQWEHSFEDYVREQPVKSVLIAAGVGLVLGFIWRRS